MTKEVVISGNVILSVGPGITVDGKPLDPSIDTMLSDSYGLRINRCYFCQNIGEMSLAHRLWVILRVAGMVLTARPSTSAEPSREPK